MKRFLVNQHPARLGMEQPALLRDVGSTAAGPSFTTAARRGCVARKQRSRNLSFVSQGFAILPAAWASLRGAETLPGGDTSAKPTQLPEEPN
jgi:hypothetical protein